MLHVVSVLLVLIACLDCFHVQSPYQRQNVVNNAKQNNFGMLKPMHGTPAPLINMQRNVGYAKNGNYGIIYDGFDPFEVDYDEEEDDDILDIAYFQKEWPNNLQLARPSHGVGQGARNMPLLGHPDPLGSLPAKQVGPIVPFQNNFNKQRGYPQANFVQDMSLYNYYDDDDEEDDYEDDQESLYDNVYKRNLNAQKKPMFLPPPNNGQPLRQYIPQFAPLFTVNSREWEKLNRKPVVNMQGQKDWISLNNEKRSSIPVFRPPVPNLYQPRFVQYPQYPNDISRNLGAVYETYDNIPQNEQRTTQQGVPIGNIVPPLVNSESMIGYENNNRFVQAASEPISASAPILKDESNWSRAVIEVVPPLPKGVGENRDYLRDSSAYNSYAGEQKKQFIATAKDPSAYNTYAGEQKKQFIATAKDPSAYNSYAGEQKKQFISTAKDPSAYSRERPLVPDGTAPKYDDFRALKISETSLTGYNVDKGSPRGFNDAKSMFLYHDVADYDEKGSSAYSLTNYRFSQNKYLNSVLSSSCYDGSGRGCVNPEKGIGQELVVS